MIKRQPSQVDLMALEIGGAGYEYYVDTGIRSVTWRAPFYVQARRSWEMRQYFALSLTEMRAKEAIRHANNKLDESEDK